MIAGICENEKSKIRDLNIRSILDVNNGSSIK